MLPSNPRRWLAVFLVLALPGPAMVLAGPLLDKCAWYCWEKHFDGDGYSPLHYWAPSLYTFRAYHRPVEFNMAADPYPPTPVGAQAYPFRTPPPLIPAPSEMKLDVPRPPENRFVEPIDPPARKAPIDKGAGDLPPALPK